MYKHLIKSIVYVFSVLFFFLLATLIKRKGNVYPNCNTQYKKKSIFPNACHSSIPPLKNESQSSVSSDLSIYTLILTRDNKYTIYGLVYTLVQNFPFSKSVFLFVYLYGLMASDNFSGLMININKNMSNFNIKYLNHMVSTVRYNYNNILKAQFWWYMRIIPIVKRLGKKDCEFETIPNYTERLSQNKTKSGM